MSGPCIDNRRGCFGRCSGLTQYNPVFGGKAIASICKGACVIGQDQTCDEEEGMLERPEADIVLFGARTVGA